MNSDAMGTRRLLRLGISSKLTIAISLVCMSTGILIGVLSLQTYRQAVEQELMSSLEALATITESSMEQWRTNLERTIESISHRSGLEQQALGLVTRSIDDSIRDPLITETVDDHLAGVTVESDFFTSLTLTNAETGIIVASTDLDRIGKYNLGVPVIDDPFQGARARAITYHRAKQVLEMAVDAPVQADGEVIAILSGNVNLSLLDTFVSSHEGIGVDENIYLVNHSHFFVTDPRDADDTYALQRTVRTAGVEHALADGAYVGEYLDYRDVAVWGASRWLEDWNLVLVVEKDLDVALMPVKRLQRIVIIIVAACVAAFAVAGSLIARSLSKPIRMLTSGAHRLGQGDFSYRINWVGRDELGELAETFNQMVENLQAITASRDELDEENKLRRRAEQKLRRAVTELRRSNEELEQFAYVASHDLQEPLRMIASYTELIEKRYASSLDSDGQDFVRYAVDGALRMQRLIQDLLAFSRVQSRGKRFDSVCLESIVGEAMRLLQAPINESCARITHTPLPVVMGDSAQLVQLLQNLLGNAIKFSSRDTPRVHISAHETDEEFRFEVADNGIGIKEEFAERIFVIFERLHGRKKYPGTGIGLAICRRIVERHCGTIRAMPSSCFESGATFVFTLPKEPKEFSFESLAQEIDKI